MSEGTAESTGKSSALQTYFRARVRSLTITATVLLFIFTALSLPARHWWVSDICANLRIQWWVGLIAVAGLSALQRRRKLFVTIIFALGIHAYYLPPAFRSVTGDRATPVIRVATANVLTSNRRYDDIEKELLNTNADVIAVLELSDGLRTHLSGAFAEQYPFTRNSPQDNGNFGIGLYSRIPFEEAKLDHFNDQRIQSVIAKVNRDGRTFRIIATHTLPPMGPGAFSHRNRHLQLLAKHVNQERIDHPETPVIVLGDLNITPWSPVFRDFLKSSKLTSAPHGLTPTWYRFPFFPFGLVLDHVLATGDLMPCEYTVSPDVGSDHRFVTAAFKMAASEMAASATRGPNI